jgi:hypothetical protein
MAGIHGLNSRDSPESIRDVRMKFTLEDDTGGYSRFSIFYMSGNTIFVRGMSFLSYKKIVLSSDIFAAELRKKLTLLMEAKKR